MKKIYLITLMLFNLSYQIDAQAPNWAWAKSAGNADGVSASAVSTDANGNVYVIGDYQNGTLTFGTTTLTTGFTYLVKYDGSGNVLWAINIGDNVNNAYPHSVCTDVNGNVYVIGDFYLPSITFGNITLTNSGSYSRDIFIVKYDTNGNVLWARSAVGNDDEYGRSVATDIYGNVFVAGEFKSSSVSFGSYTMTNGQPGVRQEVYIVKYDENGNVAWAKNGIGDSDDYVYSLTTDAKGNVYTTGEFYSTTLGFGSTVLTKNGSSDLYIVKYDSIGNMSWAKREGGTGYDRANSVSVDVNGNVCLAGAFESPNILFGTTTLTNSYNGFADMFIVKYDENGIVQWAKRAGGTSTDDARSVACDLNGDIYVSGFFDSSISFGSTTFTPSSYGDLYIVKYDGSGNVLWAKSVMKVSLNSMTSDAGGNIYVIGSFHFPTAVFGSFTLTNTGGSNQTADMFLARIGNVSTNIGNEISYNKMNIYPNPFISEAIITFNEEQKHSTIKITDVLGKEVRSINFSGNQLILEKGELKAGIYFMQIVSADERITNTKIVIQ